VGKALYYFYYFYFGASWARRRPENCQRVAGVKKLR
jgi:hypothetical protein